MGLLILSVSVESKALMFGIRFSDLTEQTIPAVANVGTKGRFGGFLGAKQKNSVFLIGADYDRFKMQGDSLLYSRRLTVDIGYRYQLFAADKADAMKISPFIGIHYFKSFSQVTGDSGIKLPSGLISSPEVIKYLKDLANDSGMIVSAGAEYYFAPVFSFGAEGGIRYGKASSSALGYSVKISQYNSYVALLLSFYL